MVSLQLLPNLRKLLSGFLIRHLAGAVGFSLSELGLKLLDRNCMLLI